MTRNAFSRWAVLATFLVLGTVPLRADAPDKPPPAATPKEVELGQKAAAEFEKAKTTKLLDPKSSPEAAALVAKLNTMVKKLGEVSARPKINYSVKVVEDDDVNAFTLPNGHIYMFRGLLDFAASDDEIAGVLAHEIGHNSCMHALRGQAKAKKLSWASLAAMAAILAGGRSGADVAQFSQYLLVGVMNGYGVEYEKEADATAVPDMVAAGYNPSALVTFMRRLETKEKRSPEVRLGIFQTHPASEERAEACLQAISGAGLKFTPRDVTGGVGASVKEYADRWSVELADIALVEIARSGKNSRERADAAATRINDLLRAGLQMHQVTVSADARLLGQGTEIATATAADAALPPTPPSGPGAASPATGASPAAGASGQATLTGKTPAPTTATVSLPTAAPVTTVTPQAVALRWQEQFRRLFWKERLNGRF